MVKNTHNERVKATYWKMLRPIGVWVGGHWWGELTSLNLAQTHAAILEGHLMWTKSEL